MLITFGLYGAVGFQLAFAIVAGLYLGNLADEKWGTSPWMLLVGLMVGGISGFYALIRILNFWKKEE